MRWLRALQAKVLTYQILTQRAERLPRFFSQRPAPGNVGLGVTVEDRRYGLPRVERLRQVKARVRFLSVEPLLEDLGPLDLRGMHWVIVGGESGPNARPLRPEWALAVRDRCLAAGVAFCFASSRGAPGGWTACAAISRPTEGNWPGGCGTNGRRSRGRCLERFA